MCGKARQVASPVALCTGRAAQGCTPAHWVLAYPSAPAPTVPTWGPVGNHSLSSSVLVEQALRLQGEWVAGLQGASPVALAAAAAIKSPVQHK